MEYINCRGCGYSFPKIEVECTRCGTIQEEDWQEVYQEEVNKIMDKEAWEVLYSIWSDMYKDVWGIRPRGIDASRWSYSELQDACEELQVMILEQIEEEKNLGPEG